MNQQEAMSVARAKGALTIISPKESLQALANFETLKAALKPPKKINTFLLCLHVITSS